MARSACQQAHPSSPLGLLSRTPIYADTRNGTNHSKNLLDEAITLVFAGQDTSAATLSWTLHCAYIRSRHSWCESLEPVWPFRLPHLGVVTGKPMRPHPFCPCQTMPWLAFRSIACTEIPCFGVIWTISDRNVGWRARVMNLREISELARRV
jgi:hypothetical protein